MQNLKTAVTNEIQAVASRALLKNGAEHIHKNLGMFEKNKTYFLN